MTTHTRLRWGAVVFVALVVLLLGGAHLCGVAQDPGSRPLSTGALACTEFWLNRYQTLLGAAAALVAARIAWHGVREQIARADKQLVIANQQSAIALLPALDARIGNAAHLRATAFEIGRRIFTLRNLARDVFGNAQLLKNSIGTGLRVQLSAEAFKPEVYNYIKQVEFFGELVNGFATEWRRGLAGPYLWTDCEAIELTSSRILLNHQQVFPYLKRCADTDFSLSPAEAEIPFFAIGNFQDDNFTAEIDFDALWRKMYSDIETLRTERERCLALSRL